MRRPQRREALGLASASRSLVGDPYAGITQVRSDGRRRLIRPLSPVPRAPVPGILFATTLGAPPSLARPQSPSPVSLAPIVSSGKLIAHSAAATCCLPRATLAFTHAT